MDVRSMHGWNGPLVHLLPYGYIFINENVIRKCRRYRYYLILIIIKKVTQASNGFNQLVRF